MRRLVFKEVSILSKVEKAARLQAFGPALNLLTGENDVGKSTLIKSLYHALGADVPGLKNAHWKNAKPIYCVRFSVDGKDYAIIRDEKYFGAFDGNDNFIGKYVGITGPRGLAQFINPLLSFRIELERSEDEKLGVAGPAFFFLPFYIDQDDGWTRSWTSFGGLQQFSDYRKHMLEYHLGVRPQSYYDARKRSLEFTEEKAKLERERLTLSGVRESYRKRKVIRQVDIDPASFRKEVEELVDQYNKVYGSQQVVLQKLKDIRNERHSLENEIIVLQRAANELNADYAFSENSETPDLVECPTCGTQIENSITARFGILDDIDRCFELIDQRRKKIVDMAEQQSAIEEEYRRITAELVPIDKLLQRKRKDVTFAEFVTVEGYKEIMNSLSADINGLLEREHDVDKSLQGLESALKPDTRRKREINEYYQARMKEFLSELSVNVLDTKDYKTIDRQIKTNALGSDLPRSLLAQCFAFLHTMENFNAKIVCPLVIDSPLQQEQDASNAEAIFKFIFSKVLPQQQLILGTITTAMLPPKIIPKEVNTIHLANQELHLLQPDAYAEVMDKIGGLHRATLAVD
jgi:hypothetical protein